MDICSKNHVEIVHDEGLCPLCEAMNAHKEEVDDVKKMLADAEAELADLRADNETPE